MTRSGRTRSGRSAPTSSRCPPTARSATSASAGWATRRSTSAPPATTPTSAAFFTKWLDDVEEAQRDFGAYPDYCPYPDGATARPAQTCGTAWTDAGIICPWTIWQVYGDTRVIERHWASMTRFMDWRQKRDPRLAGRPQGGNTWGDWLNVNENTPIEFIDPCYHALDAKLMADMAEAIGAGDEAANYRQLFSRCRGTRSRSTTCKPDGTSERGHADRLRAGACGSACCPKHRPRSRADMLAEKIAEERHPHGHRFPRHQAAAAACSRPRPARSGRAAVPEPQVPVLGLRGGQRRDQRLGTLGQLTKEHGFNGAGGNQNASMNSFSHYSFGAVMEWAFRDLAGIDTQGPGFGHLLIRPGPSAASTPDAAPLSWVKASYNHPRGRIVSNWSRRTARAAN